LRSFWSSTLASCSSRSHRISRNKIKMIMSLKASGQDLTCNVSLSSWQHMRDRTLQHAYRGWLSFYTNLVEAKTYRRIRRRQRLNWCKKKRLLLHTNKISRMEVIHPFLKSWLKRKFSQFKSLNKSILLVTSKLKRGRSSF